MSRTRRRLPADFGLIAAARDWLRLVTGPASRLLWRRIVLVLMAGMATWAMAGLGFWWIEPTVQSWHQGMWLAFTTGATVGYGDFVPTTPASRIFAVLMVLLGMAFLSLATATIAALMVGETEVRIEHDMLAEMRALHAQVQALHERLARAEQAAAAQAAAAQAAAAQATAAQPAVTQAAVTQADSASAVRTASSVNAISSSPWAPEKKNASTGDGGR